MFDEVPIRSSTYFSYCGCVRTSTFLFRAAGCLCDSAYAWQSWLQDRRPLLQSRQTTTAFVSYLSTRAVAP